MGPQEIQLSDFVGEHGSYQLTLTVLLFIRYVFLGLMANSGPLMTPDVTFYCWLPMDEVLAIMPNISSLSKGEQEMEIREEFKRVCQLDLHLYQQNAYLNTTTTQRGIGQHGHISTGNSLGLLTSSLANTTTRIRECTDFTFDIAPDQGRTMTSEFDLVCERDWLRSLFQSLLSAAIVIAHVFVGTFSDKYGRFQAMRLCLLISLVAGVLSIFAADFWSFVVARALCSFGDLGLVVSLTTTVVELVGNKYRGLSVAIVNFGYALGVTMLPYIVAYFEDFRLVIAFTVLCHIFTIPFILGTNESVRWLMTNGRYQSARKELKRIVRWNKKVRLWYSRQPSNASAHQEGRKISSAERRQAYEMLFTKFVEHFESQRAAESAIDSDPPSGGSIAPEIPSSQQGEPASDNRPDNQTNQQEQETLMVVDGQPDQSMAGASVEMEPPVNYKLNLDLEPPTPPLPLIVRTPIESEGRLCVSVDTLCAPTTIEQQARLVAKQRLAADDYCFEDISDSEAKKSTDESATRRAYNSCLHLESLAKSGPEGRLVVRDYLKRTLTLPAISRATSKNDSFILDFVHEYKDAPLRGHQQHQQQPDCINMVAHQLSFVGRVSRLFKDKQLMITVFTIVWTTFNSELQYTSYIIINLEVGEDVYLNYILGGCMEALAAVIASLLLSYAPRRHSLITFWLLISLSCFGLSVAHIDSTWAVWLLALAKFSQSTLSSIASVAAYESFPTSLRQSGSGLVFTLGMLGSVFAPLIFAEFDDHAGMDRVLMTFSLSSLTAALLIYKYLRETRGCELQ